MNVKTKYLVLLLLILSAIFVCFIIFNTDVRTKNSVYVILIYPTETGFGYSISHDNKLIIKQDIIPVIQSSHPFCDFNDAQKVAGLVKKKLMDKKAPNVSLKELKSLNIKLNCSN